MIETKFAVRRIFTIIWVTCAKTNFEIRTLIKKLLAKYWFLKTLPQISNIHKNRNFLKYDCSFLDQLLLPYSYKSHGSSMRGILFFNNASCEPLKQYTQEMPNQRVQMNYVWGSLKMRMTCRLMCNIVWCSIQLYQRYE